jgi:Xaa-Pro dipeptidase
VATNKEKPQIPRIEPVIFKGEVSCNSWRRFLFGAVVILCFSVSCARSGGDGSSADGFQWPEEPVSPSGRRLEAEQKVGRVRAYLSREHLGGLLIGRPENVSWITAGAENADEAFLFLRGDGGRFLIACADKMQWLQGGMLKDLGYEGRTVPWFGVANNAGPVLLMAAELGGGAPFGSDLPFREARPADSAIRDLHVPLTEWEVAKYRWLGKACAEAVSRVCREVQPGMTEPGIESMIMSSLARRAIRPVEILIAADDRIYGFRAGPASDSGKLERFVRIGVRASRWGITVALTRFVHFGPLPRETRDRLTAAARIAAGFWARTVPGATAGSILQGAIADYAETGHADEWKAGIQGGAFGYGPREWPAVPGSQQKVSSAGVFAWCPGIRGVSVEDTILVSGENLENLTEVSGWPVVEASALGHVYRLPAILVR